MNSNFFSYFTMLLTCLFASQANSWADDTRKKTETLSLHPTQFSVGLREVDKEMKDMKAEKDLDAYLKDRPVPVIVGPNRTYYMTDKHHMVKAAWEVGQEQVWIEIKKDYSDLDTKTFWEKMKTEKLVYLIDNFGEGPRSPLYLPPDVRCLANDEFRSLSKEAYKKNCYDKSPLPFAEFQWAEFFRKKISIEELTADFKGATKKALELCKSPEAKDLPGFKK